jgi:hypothetical protein
VAEDHNYLVPTGRFDTHCHEGSPGNGQTCQTDNVGVTFYMDSNGEFELESPDRADVNAGIDQNYRPTDLTFTYDSTPSFSGDAETDIVYQEGTLPDGYDGYTWCNDAIGFYTSYKCDQHYIRIRGAGVYTEGIVCHETGHAVGLVHGEDTTSGYGNQDSTHMGCMVKSGVSATATIRSGQVADINDVYPN